MSGFPHRRMRRLRRSEGLRALRRETVLAPSDFIQPVFVAEDPAEAGALQAMPGIHRFALDKLSAYLDSVCSAGIEAIMLFGLPRIKDAHGSQAYADNGVVSEAIRRIRRASFPATIVADLCLCQFTDHGHCGVVHGESIDNDATLPLLAKAAVVYARAGADVVAPSGMMDGAVAAIRAGLDEAGFREVPILSYAAKFASGFYGPFREAVDSTPRFGDRRSYQMDPANAREALAELALDADEGADLLMVKPALPYLDVIRRARETFPGWPLFAYQVSGEYSMIKAAAANGWLEERRIALECLTAIKRAGADRIITYYAKEAAEWLRR